MHLTHIAGVRRLAILGAVSSALWCGQVYAQVLDQVPSDAVAVFKIKNLEKTNDKVAKLAKTFGLDEMAPQAKDPLGAALEQAHMTKGIDKSGDAALAVFAPDKKGGEEPEPLAIIPVSDYDAFVGNFKKADKAADAQGVTAVQDPDDANKTLFIAHHGKFAVMSDKEKHLNDKGGLKLSPQVQAESDEKDAVFILNVAVVREKALPEIKDHRKEWTDNLDKEITSQEAVKPYAPVLITLVNHALDTAEDFLNDADGIAFSLNITDTAINGGALVDFKNGSKFGTTAAKLKAGETPLLAGLPQGKYFFVGGSSVDPKAIGSITDEWIDPVVKGLNDSNTDFGKKLANLLTAFKPIAGTVNHSAAGWVVPTKPMGQESLVQEIVVSYGDAKAMEAAEKQTMTDMNDFMGMLPQNKGAKTSIVIGDPKTIDDVKLTTYKTKIEFDKNDPQGAQAEQILAMIYGPEGQSGEFGAVNDKTFVLATGAPDEVLKELISSAKDEKDVLSDTGGYKTVAGQFPGKPTVVYYISLDNILTSALHYAQGFGLPIKLKLPQNLAPIGVAISAKDSSVRMDSVVPVDTVQAIIAAGLQAYTDMQGGKGGGL